MSENHFTFRSSKIKKEKRRNRRWVADDVSDDGLRWLVKLNSCSWDQSWAVRMVSVFGLSERLIQKVKRRPTVISKTAEHGGRHRTSQRVGYMTQHGPQSTDECTSLAINLTMKTRRHRHVSSQYVSSSFSNSGIGGTTVRKFYNSTSAEPEFENWNKYRQGRI